MQATSDDDVSLEFIITVYTWVTLHTFVERQKCIGSLCMPAYTGKEKGPMTNTEQSWFSLLPYMWFYKMSIYLVLYKEKCMGIDYTVYTSNVVSILTFRARMLDTGNAACSAQWPIVAYT